MHLDLSLGQLGETWLLASWNSAIKDWRIIRLKQDWASQVLPNRWSEQQGRADVHQQAACTQKLQQHAAWVSAVEDAHAVVVHQDVLAFRTTKSHLPFYFNLNLPLLYDLPLRDLRTGTVYSRQRPTGITLEPYQSFSENDAPAAALIPYAILSQFPIECVLCCIQGASQGPGGLDMLIVTFVNCLSPPTLIHAHVYMMVNDIQIIIIISIQKSIF